jgi:cytochrome c oxidase subunit III
MATTTIAPPKPKSPSGPAGTGRDGDGFGRGGSGGGEFVWSVPDRAYRTGVWMGLAAVTMLFAALTSALVVRKGLSNDWVPTALPPVLYFNTLVLLASSGTFELSRRALKLNLASPFLRWLYATLALGLVFIAGQLLAWRELALRGVYLATNPSSSFFYVLTAAHGVHLLGGIVALGYLAACGRKIAEGRKKRLAVECTALYWHFMDGLWIYLFILLSVRF